MAKFSQECTVQNREKGKRGRRPTGLCDPPGGHKIMNATRKHAAPHGSIERPHQPTPEPWLTLKECAPKLRMSYESLRVAALDGRVPCVNVGNGNRFHPRFRMSEVEQALASRRRSA